MTRLLLLRHGQSTWNAEGRWQGSADTPLTALGERQAADVAVHLEGAGFTLVCSSALQRAHRTALILAIGLGLGDVVVEPGLRERHVGAFTGLTGDEIRRRWPECFDPGGHRMLFVPEGESDDDVWDRAGAAVVALAARFPDDRILVVTHGGVLRAIERHFDIDLPPSNRNLAGRWYDVEGGRLVPDDPCVPLEPELATAPESE